MELRQLKYFVTVAEELHFGRAATRVGIEQSPLSKAIRDFESDLGVRLFCRTTRSTQLTTAGEAFLADARCVLAAAERATQNLQERVAPLRLGIEPGLTGDHLITWLTRWRKRAEPSAVRLIEVRRAELLAHLENCVLDAAIMTDAQSELGYESHLLWREPLAVLLPLGHRLYARQKLSLRELTDERVMATERVAERCSQLQARVVPIGMLTSLVAAGFGIGIATREALATASTDTVERPLLDKLAPLTISLVWPPERSARIERLVRVDAVVGAQPTATVPAAAPAPS